MFKVELKEGTSVFTSGGEAVGKINRIVLDPATNEVTHLVVQKGWLYSEDKVVPFEMVDSATEDKVVLKENIDNFDGLPPYEEAHYIRTRDADLTPGERSSSLEEAGRVARPVVHLPVAGQHRLLRGAQAFTWDRGDRDGAGR